ncbi:prolyl oligopeptidase family serine peptidase [Spiractinospora alimapuensis]|uniref:alpha/beta hydrolase family protein n=1 Tax=Spiractinospora alimapuensis TaxID=2820884 RepID=UPI001F25D9CB|nr:prolyl oligopeptidase family serine peptidase [Spiractinospora alimapuensis]QVQ50859.1 prolyl oligopeptidase family serine peptidase [Spiractinospora alimapuensis]
MSCARKQLRPTAVVLLTALCLALAWSVLPARADATPSDLAPSELVTEEVTVPSDGAALDGTLVIPQDHAVDLPGLVMITGAGGMRQDYTAEAEELARSGIAVLLYDKRPTQRPAMSFDVLAADALAAVDLLSDHEATDPDRIGVWGHSEGAWVAPLAASESDEVAFVVAVAGSAYSPDRSQLWSNRVHLTHAGVRESLLAPLGERLSRMLVDLDAYGDVDHDPLATMGAVTQPILIVAAEHDRSVPAGESVGLLRDALAEHPHHTIRVVADADHGMRHSEDGFDVDRSAPFAAGYPDLVTEWIHPLDPAEPVASVDEAPEQDTSTEPVAALSWFETSGAHATAVLLMLVCFASMPVTMLVRRIRRRPRDPSRWWLLSGSAAGIGVALGTPVYLFTIVMSGASTVTTTVLGRPLPWLVLQLLASFLVVAALVVATSRVRAARANRAGSGSTAVPITWGLSLPTLGAALFVPWATLWGLFTI